MRRNAVITGGSRGIGNAIAQVLDERGWNLFLVSEDASRLTSATLKIKNVIGSVAVDLGSGEAAAQTVENALRAVTDSLDLLVLNAGIFVEESLANVESSNLRRNMAVNLEANIFLVKHLLRYLLNGRHPRIIIIGSVAAYEAYPLGPVYGIAKWALRGFAVNLRRELMEEDIGITLISPGGTLTDMWAGEDLPPARLLDPHDVATLVAAVTELSPQAVVDEIILRPIKGDVYD